MFFARLCTVVLFATLAHSQADAMSYAIRAQTFVVTITKNGALPVPDGLTKYLHDRVKNSAAQGEEREIEAGRVLRSDAVFFVVRNHLESNIAARIPFYFAQMVEENVVYRIRKGLGCRSGEPAEFEQDYIPQLQQVTPEEYDKRASEKYDHEAVMSMKLEESKKMAEAILQFFANSQSMGIIVEDNTSHKYKFYPTC